MSFTRAAIDKNRVTFVILAVLVVAGIQAYLGMPQSEDPGFIIRTAMVQTIFPGASPERVEQLVTDKLEKAIQEIPQLDSVTSQSKTGVSIIMVNILESYKEMRPIWDDLRRKVETGQVGAAGRNRRPRRQRRVRRRLRHRSSRSPATASPTPSSRRSPTRCATSCC